MDHCVTNGNMTWGSTEELEEECVDGIVEMTVVVYLDDDFDPDECEACNVNDLSELGGGNFEFCAYQVEIPCEEVPVECAPPTAEPSSSPTTASPTFVPTQLATTLSPTAVEVAATKAPIVTNGEDDDDDKFFEFEPACAQDVKLVAMKGRTEIDPNRVVSIVSQDVSTVTVNLKQGWTSEATNNTISSIERIFYSYRQDNFNQKCYEETEVESDVIFADSIELRCLTNVPYSLLEICVEDEGFLTSEDNGIVPKCCHANDGEEEEKTPTVCYTIEIKCVTECVDDDSVSTFVDELVARKNRRGLRGSNPQL